jgi:hypothetical protein
LDQIADIAAKPGPLAGLHFPVQNSGAEWCRDLGYARSTDGQSVDAQVPRLRAAGAATVFREVARGAKTDRAQFGRSAGCSGRSTLATRRW